MSPLRDLNEDRDIRTSALLLGHIKLGIFNGRHPQATDTFRFTSADRARLEPLARDFGGEIRAFRPQGAGTDTWELISEADAFTAIFPFPDVEGNITQDWKLWKRSGLERLCDGYTCTVYSVDEETGERDGEQTDCVCAAKGHRDCSAETRLRFLLAQTGLGIWELTTGSKIAALDLHDQVRAIAGVAAGRMNQVPIRVTYAPREISYIDEKDRKRKTTTKRLVSLSVAGDAAGVIAALQMRPERALYAAVETALRDVGRELIGVSSAPALGAGAASTEGSGSSVSGEGADGRGEVGVEEEAPGTEDPGLDAVPGADSDEPASTEAWERAAKAGLSTRKAVAIAKGLGFSIRSATELTGTQLSQVLAKYLDGER